MLNSLGDEWQMVGDPSIDDGCRSKSSRKRRRTGSDTIEGGDPKKMHLCNTFLASVVLDKEVGNDDDGRFDDIQFSRDGLMHAGIIVTAFAVICLAGVYFVNSNS